MLKRNALNRIYLTTIILFLMLITITIDYIKDKKSINIYETEYVSNFKTSHIYLLNEDNFLVKVDYLLRKNNLYENIKDILDELNINNKKNNNLKGLIPSNTKINNIKIDNKTVIIDFSKDLLKINRNLEEKLIESIVYSLIDLDEIDNVKILIDGNNLTKLEKSNKNLPNLLNESIGINKYYDINNVKNIEKVIIYYVFNYNESDYYVPVTKYINTNENKVKIIIDSLKGNYFSNTNLRSYLSRKDDIDFKIDNDVLTFSFKSLNQENLESVTYSLASSVFDSLDINKVIFEVESKIVDIKTK